MCIYIFKYIFNIQHILYTPHLFLREMGRSAEVCLHPSVLCLGP